MVGAFDSGETYMRARLLFGYRHSTMDGAAYSSNVPTEVRPRKPRTLVLCFDGTSNQFRNHVRQTAHSSDVTIPLDIVIS
jgi:hypothetical protein